KPLTALREYVHSVRGLLHDGAINFEGETLVARAQTGCPVSTPVLCAATGLGAYELAGELSDGAISWVAPRSYLEQRALPALRRGAAKAKREAPPLVAHVALAATADRQRAQALARHHLAHFGTYQHFGGMWAAAGFDPKAG